LLTTRHKPELERPQPLPAQQPVRSSGPGAEARGRFTFGFGLVLVLNGLLLIRPEELLPELDGLRLYQLTIAACLVLYGFSILEELSWSRLSRTPLLFLVLGLPVTVVVSHLGNGRLGRGVGEGLEFAKLVAYVLVLLAALRTRAHVRWFLRAVLVCIVVQTTLGLGQYFGYLNIEALKPFEQPAYNEEQEVYTFLRLCGSGIYHDPNDLCLLLTLGMLLCLNSFLSARGPLRTAWLLPFGYFGFALTLTQSRGGLLMAAAGLGTYTCARYGGKRGALFLLLLAPVGLVGLGGRQTSFDLSSREDTSQARILLWRDALGEFAANPMFGVGSHELDPRIGNGAHNSFVHALVELGPVGGALFTAAFVFAVWTVATTRPGPGLTPDATRELAGFRLVLFGLLASYIAGMFSLSRNYVPPTYLNLALATIYLRLAAPAGLKWFVVNPRFLWRVAQIGLATYALHKLLVILLAQQ
jgi:hypothetical protein